MTHIYTPLNTHMFLLIQSKQVFNRTYAKLTVDFKPLEAMSFFSEVRGIKVCLARCFTKIRHPIAVDSAPSGRKKAS